MLGLLIVATIVDLVLATLLIGVSVLLGTALSAVTIWTAGLPVGARCPNTCQAGRSSTPIGDNAPHGRCFLDRIRRLSKSAAPKLVATSRSSLSVANNAIRGQNVACIWGMLGYCDATPLVSRAIAVSANREFTSRK
jgi:hypothetical protein